MWPARRRRGPPPATNPLGPPPAAAQTGGCRERPCKSPRPAGRNHRPRPTPPHPPRRNRDPPPLPLAAARPAPQNKETHPSPPPTARAVPRRHRGTWRPAGAVDAVSSATRESHAGRAHVAAPATSADCGHPPPSVQGAAWRRHLQPPKDATSSRRRPPGSTAITPNANKSCSHLPMRPRWTDIDADDRRRVTTKDAPQPIPTCVQRSHRKRPMQTDADTRASKSSVPGRQTRAPPPPARSSRRPAADARRSQRAAHGERRPPPRVAAARHRPRQQQLRNTRPSPPLHPPAAKRRQQQLPPPQQQRPQTVKARSERNPRPTADPCHRRSPTPPPPPPPAAAPAPSEHPPPPHSGRPPPTASASAPPPPHPASSTSRWPRPEAGHTKEGPRRGHRQRQQRRTAGTGHCNRGSRRPAHPRPLPRHIRAGRNQKQT